MTPEAGFNKVVLLYTQRSGRGSCCDRHNRTDHRSWVCVSVTGRYLPDYFEAGHQNKASWGTGQAALLQAKNVLSEPFMVINADYYGKRSICKSITTIWWCRSSRRMDFFISVWLDSVWKYLSDNEAKSTVEASAIEKRSAGWRTETLLMIFIRLENGAESRKRRREQQKSWINSLFPWICGDWPRIYGRAGKGLCGVSES